MIKVEKPQSDELDREEFEAYQLNDEQIEKMFERKARGHWNFRSRASKLRLDIVAKEDRVLASGKTLPGDRLSAKFDEHVLRTRDWELAKGIYLSDAFNVSRKIYDDYEVAIEAEEKAYADFLKRVKDNPEKLARLQKDIDAGVVSLDIPEEEEVVEEAPAPKKKGAAKKGASKSEDFV